MSASVTAGVATGLRSQSAPANVLDRLELAAAAQRPDFVGDLARDAGSRLRDVGE
jgi:hypothetical protein